MAVAVLAAALALAGGLLLAGSGGADAAAQAKYGQIPSWLPKAKVPVGRIVRASAAHPWVAIEGDSVAVTLAQGRVLATAVGPQVPAEGQFPLPRTSPCTFVVTFADGHGRVPLRAGAFTIVDEFGRVHDPRVSALSGGAPPSLVPAHGTVSLRMSDVLPVGSGTLRWAPRGGRPVVSWGFDVEID